MTPISTPDQLSISLETVLPIVLVAAIVVVVAVGLRSVLMTAADELAELWRTYGPVAITGALAHRRGLPRTPWYCARCSSYNGLAARRCYHCGGTREECEAPAPDADAPAGAGAGLDQRTRRTG